MASAKNLLNSLCEGMPLTAKQLRARIEENEPLTASEFENLDLEGHATYLLHYHDLQPDDGDTWLNEAQLAAAIHIGLIELDSEGLVNCHCGINLRQRGLKQLPYRFGKVGGQFWCGGNFLNTLHGTPSSVGKDFSCAYNELSNLRGGPSYVGGSFACYGNHLTTLDGAPRTVGGAFSCYGNRLVNLRGAPDSVGGNFTCHSNAVGIALKAPPNCQIGGTFIAY